MVYCFRGDSGLLCPRFVWTAVLAVQTIIPGDESLTVPVAKIISVALFTADDRDWRETDLGVDDSYVLSSHRRGTASKVPLGHLYLLPCVPFAQDDCAQLLLMTTAALDNGDTGFVFDLRQLRICRHIVRRLGTILTIC